MLLTFKLVKNTIKFILCFIVILSMYYYRNYPVSRPQQWTIKQYLKTPINTSHISMYDTTIHNNLKYILIWNKVTEFEILKKGQEAFIENNCTFNNCFVSTHRNMLYNDYTNFHAIVFSGKKVAKVFVDGYMKLPKKRLPNQTYIFAMKEDAVTYPICFENFDDYFNLTWTYKLDSDIIWPYFKVLDIDNTVVGPKINIDWAPKSGDNTMVSEVQEKLLDKELYAVWISSNCHTPSLREDIVRRIKLESNNSKNILDTVGDCGSKECPSENHKECMLAVDDYNFYLAFETVLVEDYVTSEVLDAINHLCVPVVYGGANYSRFLPPGSYIDVKQLGITATVKLMGDLMFNVAAYVDYFEWRTAYKIVENDAFSICDLCEALNRDKVMVRRNFREWWNPGYRNICTTKRKRYVRSFKRIWRSRESKLGLWP